MALPIAKVLDFTENWINSIDKEVLRGVKVRDEKLKSNQSNSINQYDLVDIDFTKPSCSKSNGSEIRRTLKSRKLNSHRSVSPQRKKRYKKLKKNKQNGRNTCGMRIAELAVPSKRHCMDTWRSRWDTLPTLMVDRLRQIVLDQKPIVPIQDAIICFKQKKTNISRSPNKGHKTVKSKKTKEMKMFCGLFGFRISSQLQAPRNLTLGSSLTPISHVVNDEISRLLVKSKTSKLQKNIQLEISNKITNWIADILEQSTYNLMLDDYMELEKEEGHIWDIIDDLVDHVALICKETSSSSDVIETESSESNPSLNNEDNNEDNNVSSESIHSDDNNTVPFENIISDIIELATSKVSKTQDIDTDRHNSEDNLYNDEEHSQKTPPESIENYFNEFLLNYINEITFNDEEAFEDALHSDLSDSELLDKSNDGDTIQNTIDENNDEQVPEINNDNDKDINNDFNDNIDFNENNDENTLTNDVLEHETVNESSVDNIRNSMDIMKHNYNPENISNKISVTLSDKNEIIDVIQSLPQDIEDTEVNNEINNNNNKIEESNLNIDETIPLTDITSDDSIKKVKSNISMDSGQGQLNSKSNIRDGENKKSATQGIHFAPPNNNLLSDADESWPENLTFPTVKVTVSVSKSVLSLGKITEDDETNKDPDYLNEDTKANYEEVDDIKNNNDRKNTSIEINQHIIDKNLTNNDSHPMDDDVTETNKIELDREVQQIDKNINSSSKDDVDKNLSNISDLSLIEDIKTKILEKAGENLQKIIGEVSENNESNVQVDKNLIDKANSQVTQDGGDSAADIKATEPSKIINKRVPVNLSVEHLPVIFICPKIYTHKIQCLGKPFQETKQMKSIENRQYKESEVRIWCQGLQNVIQNLDMWLDWIDNTCSNLLYLKQKEKFPPCYRNIQKCNNFKWITLKTNIDSDARLWKKLSVDLQVGLRSYTYFYQPPENVLLQLLQLTRTEVIVRNTE